MQTPMLDIDSVLRRCINVVIDFESVLPAMYMPFDSRPIRLRNDSLKQSLTGVPVLVESETPHFLGGDEVPRFYFLALAQGQFIVLEYRGFGHVDAESEHVDTWAISLNDAVA